jgi:hypothetical protein
MVLVTHKTAPSSSILTVCFSVCTYARRSSHVSCAHRQPMIGSVLVRVIAYCEARAGREPGRRLLAPRGPWRRLGEAQVAPRLASHPATLGLRVVMNTEIKF